MELECDIKTYINCAKDWEHRLIKKKKAHKSDGYAHQIESELVSIVSEYEQPASYVEDDAYQVVDACYIEMDVCFMEVEINSVEPNPGQISWYLDSGASTTSLAISQFSLPSILRGDLE